LVIFTVVIVIVNINIVKKRKKVAKQKAILQEGEERLSLITQLKGRLIYHNPETPDMYRLWCVMALWGIYHFEVIEIQAKMKAKKCIRQDMVIMEWIVEELGDLEKEVDKYMQLMKQD
jgi:hypothetical protein